jgi:hypothetical protein
MTGNQDECGWRVSVGGEWEAGGCEGEVGFAGQITAELETLWACDIAEFSKVAR